MATQHQTMANFTHSEEMISDPSNRELVDYSDQNNDWNMVTPNRKRTNSGSSTDSRPNKLSNYNSPSTSHSEIQLSNKFAPLAKTLDDNNPSKIRNTKISLKTLMPNRRYISMIQPNRYVLNESQLCKKHTSNSDTDHNYSRISNSNDMEEGQDDTLNENSSQVAKPEKIPPIFIHDVNNHQEIIKDIKKVVPSDFSTEIRGKSLKVNVFTINDYRSLTAFYDASNVKYHTFQTNIDKKLEVIIRNVPCSLSEDEIKSELTNYPVTRVARLYNKDKRPIPLCAVDLHKNENGNEIFKLDRLCYSVVSVEPKRKSKSIPQCTRCQRYGHTKNFCKLDPRCVKCTGQHHYTECTKDKNEVPTCVNCGEEHSANYKGCPFYQEVFLNPKKSNNTHSSRSKPTNRSETNNTVCNEEVTESSPSSSSKPNLKNTFSQVLKKSLNQKLINQSTSDSESNVPAHEDNFLSSTLETLITNIVKSVVPVIKKLLIEVLQSFLNNEQP